MKMPAWVIKRIGKENVKKVRLVQLLSTDIGGQHALLSVRYGDRLVGWKKVNIRDRKNGLSSIVARVTITGLEKIVIHQRQNKCRTTSVVYNGDKIGYSQMNRSFKYRPGSRVSPSKPFNYDLSMSCATGIHFFFSKTLAERS